MKLIEENEYQSNITCWLCEENLFVEKWVRDHNKQTRTYSHPEHNNCNLNCQQG